MRLTRFLAFSLAQKLKIWRSVALREYQKASQLKPTGCI
jgi:hypothetical protein